MNQITNEQCQQRALGQYLSEWPEDMSYIEIIDRLMNDNVTNEEEEKIICECEIYEGQWAGTLDRLIEDEYKSLCHFVGIEP